MVNFPFINFYLPWENILGHLWGKGSAYRPASMEI